MRLEIFQLTSRQALPLEAKIEMSKIRIKEFYEKYNGQVYVAFSGGKDSTVLLHLVRTIYPNVSAVFCDTGLEYPEIKEFIKQTSNVIWLKPKISFFQVIEKYGWPVISKQQSQYIQQFQNALSEKTKETRWNGDKWNQGKISKKWRYLLRAPFKISDVCCDIMKTNPVKKFEKKTGLKCYTGVMAVESNQRTINYLQFGCNHFDATRPVSTPLAFWLENDIWNYLKKYKIKYSKIYDLGYKRTGCIFCIFGAHLEKEPNRFQKMAKTHPKLYNYFLNKLKGKQILKYLNIKYTETNQLEI